MISLSLNGVPKYYHLKFQSLYHRTFWIPFYDPCKRIYVKISSLIVRVSFNVFSFIYQTLYKYIGGRFIC